VLKTTSAKTTNAKTTNAKTTSAKTTALNLLKKLLEIKGKPNNKTNYALAAVGHIHYFS